MSMPKPSGFWMSRSKKLGYPLGLETISQTESSPNESSNLPRQASAIPVSCVKAQSRNYAGICSETNRGTLPGLRKKRRRNEEREFARVASATTLREQDG